jgi:DNA-binding NtrC family response regulator
MHSLFHAVLIEPDAEQATLLSSWLSDLNVVVTQATTLEHAQTQLSQLQPDLLVAHIQPAAARPLYTWLSTVLGALPSSILLYAEHQVLLDAVAAALPQPIVTLSWPCSKAQLARLIVPLLGTVKGNEGVEARCVGQPYTPISGSS